MPLPRLTHLQFLILGVLLTREKSGKNIRAAMAREGAKKTGPTFYQLMARMEDAGLVEGWYEQQIVAGQIIKERWYRAKGVGMKAYNDTRAFYVDRAANTVGNAGVSRA